MYLKAKAEPQHRFWGLYVHVCKMETLREAYRSAKSNNGAPGIDGVTFKDIECSGVEPLLEQLRDELTSRTYRPLRNRIHEIPKGDGRMRRLGIPAIRDRVVQGALKLILEPIFEADFQDGSYGYRPKRSAHQAVHRVATAIAGGKTHAIDMDLKSYFDEIPHGGLLAKVAKRVNDDDVMHLLKLILKAGGKQGVPQGGVISPLLSNLYLNEVDEMLERARRNTMAANGWHYVQYARYADDLVVLVDGDRRRARLRQAVHRRLMEELAKLGVRVNTEKTCIVDLTEAHASFAFMGFDFRRVRSTSGKWRPCLTPRAKSRTKLLEKLRDVFRTHVSQPVRPLIAEINPILRGWANHFRIGNSVNCFSYVRQWVVRKVRRHLLRAKNRRGHGWKRWSNAWLYEELGLFQDYAIRYYTRKAARPTRPAT
jgi:RNA-directed DNA polymerase